VSSGDTGVFRLMSVRAIRHCAVTDAVASSNSRGGYPAWLRNLDFIPRLGAGEEPKLQSRDVFVSGISCLTSSVRGVRDDYSAWRLSLRLRHNDLVTLGR
jgi:hypothetical protein